MALGRYFHIADKHRADTMTRIVFRVVIAFALIGAGWTVGRAQTTVADFELTVNSPGGQTILELSQGL
jgi:hypothetical protein